MCGICGIYEYGRGDGSVTEPLICDMRETMRHRGPDGSGSYVSADARLGLGHRRLSIIDLAGGAQPMHGRSGVILVFNGEIYNYPLLRARLEGEGVIFETHSDTEVILHLYDLHGMDCVDHLDGMFAFALWDPHRRRVFVARDRVGEKPLYWTDQGGRFLFASEAKALFRHPHIARGVNRRMLPMYLGNLATAAPETLFENINKLEAGTCGYCDEDGVRIWRYWHGLERRPWETPPLDQAAATARELLEQAVSSRRLSDVPVGVLLSGGLDSSAIVALLAQQARDVPTFSIGFDGHDQLDEREEARGVAAHFGTDHHEIVIGEADAIRFLPTLIHHQDEPLADPVCIPLHFVCRLAREHEVPVVMAGEGADELFWGYPRYNEILSAMRWIMPLMRMPQPVRGGLARSVSAARHPFFRERLDAVATGRLQPMHLPVGMTYYYRQMLMPQADHDLLAGWQVSGDRDGVLDTLAHDTQEHEFGLRLPELLLMRIDRFSMANSVEARVPFLAPALVEWAFHLHPTLKNNGRLGKLVLRKAIESLLPAHVMNRPKRGFGAPVDAWLDETMGELLTSLLTEDCIRAYFDVDVLAERLSGGGDRKLAFSLWPILNFALWHRYWIEGVSLESLVGDHVGVG